MSAPRYSPENPPPSRDLSERDLAGAHFYNLDLSGYTFRHCDLTGARFEKCRAGIDGPPVIFSNIDRGAGVVFTGCRFHGVSIQECDFRQAELYLTALIDGHVTFADFSEAEIKAVNFSGTEFDEVRFRDAVVREVEFDPSRRVDARQIFQALFRDRVFVQRIYTSGADRSGFIDYCRNQYRISRIILRIIGRRERAPATRASARNSNPFFTRLRYAAIPLALSLTSDFGQSLNRWLATALVLNLIFTLLIWWPGGAAGPWEAAMISLQLFFDFGGGSAVIPVPAQFGVHLCGYGMLAVFIAILTREFLD